MASDRPLSRCTADRDGGSNRDRIHHCLLVKCVLLDATTTYMYVTAANIARFSRFARSSSVYVGKIFVQGWMKLFCLKRWTECNIKLCFLVI